MTTISALSIRRERSTDRTAIYALTELAFRGRPYADGDEQDVINRLRDNEALTLSLVATIDEEVVGHIAFSPASYPDATQDWYALGPVSVTPSLQGQGIGAALIESGLARIKEIGAIGCILTGNPNYYKRFGFELTPANAPENEPAEYFMVKKFSQTELQGSFAFHWAFYDEVPS